MKNESVIVADIILITGYETAVAGKEFAVDYCNATFLVSK
jgi:hypothetical protein